MMYLRDSLRLAAAKLRIHPVRTGVVLVIVSLLFAGLTFVSFIFAGIVTSVRSFGSEGLGSRYIVQAVPILDTNSYYFDDALKQSMTTVSNQLKAQKTATAKKLGITYDADNDQNLPVSKGGPSGPNDTSVNMMSPVVQDAMKQKLSATPHVSYDELSALARKSGAKAVYKSTYFDPMFGFMSSMQNYAQPVIDGKEQIRTSDSVNYGNPRGFATLTTLGWAYFDSDLLEPFVLPGQHLAVGKDGSIPVIAPMSVAEQILGLKSLPATAANDSRLARLVQIRKDIAGKTAQLCYRNASSADLLQQAVQQEKEIAANKGKKDYVAPSLQYTVPVDACGEVTVKKDTRTYDEKKQAANELSFKRQFENYEDPVQQIMTVRMVGLVPDQDTSYGFSMSSIISSVLRSSLGNGWFSPIGTVTDGSAASHISPPYAQASLAGKAYYAEFSSLADARSFAKKNQCKSDKMQAMMSPTGGQTRMKECQAAGTFYDISPFGNNASALEDMRQNIWKGLKVVIPVLLIIVSLVLMGVVGKIIADSRRETAVFRALGASRGVIDQIYFTYSVYLAGIITVLALVIGTIAAFLFNQRYSDQASVTAAIAYNASDIHKHFVFFGVDVRYLAVIAGLVLVATIFSTALPLMTNIRRNPIRDMRDEN